MLIWWCEEHNLQGEAEHCEDGTEDAPRDDWCRMIKKRFVSIEALVLEPDQLDDLRTLYVRARNNNWGAFAFVDAVFEATENAETV